MIVPFMSYAWNAYAGKFGEPLVRVFADVANAGRQGAIDTLRRVKGHRAVLFQNAEVGMFQQRADRLQGQYQSLWFTHGIANTKANFTALIEQFHANGGDIDLAVFDIESAPNVYVLSQNDLNAIYADPRYAALAAGGNFPADCRNMNEAQRLQFNYGCAILEDAAIHAALIAPLYARYANVNWCNFTDAPITKADAARVPEANNHAQYYAASSAPIAAPAMYAYIGLLKTFDARFSQAWYVLALSVNTMRAAYRAKPSIKLLPWLAPRIQSNVLDLASWQELVYHTCCLCGPQILYFNGDDFTALSNWRFDNAVSQYVGQCRGKVWTKPLVTDLTDYDAQCVVTAGKHADGTTTGRVTFKTGVDSVNVNVAGKWLTVKRTAGSIGTWFHY